jgi:hypothetical protein
MTNAALNKALDKKEIDVYNLKEAEIHALQMAYEFAKGPTLFPYESRQTARGQEIRDQLTGKWYSPSFATSCKRDVLLSSIYYHTSNSEKFDKLFSDSNFVFNGIVTRVPRAWLDSTEEKPTKFVVDGVEYELTEVRWAYNTKFILKSEFEYLKTMKQVVRPSDNAAIWTHISECVFFEDTEEYILNVNESYPDFIYIENDNEYYTDELAVPYDIVYVNDYGWYCLDYAIDNFYQHSYNGDWYDYPEEDEYGLDDYSFDPASYWGYETKKSGNKRRPIKGQLYYGLELEYELDDPYDSSVTSELVNDAHELHFGACEDSSLDEGVEFKSKPLCIELVKKRTEKLLNEIRGRVSSASTCGLHIHVSKSALSLMQIGLIQEFIYNPENKEFINKISGRSPNTYCQRNFSYKKTSRLAEGCGQGGDEKKKDFYCNEKYEALNFQHTHTIEFRMFRSSMRKHRVIGRIEFIQALIQWCGVSCRQTSLDVIDHKNFIEFVKTSGRKRFPMLLELMYEKDILQKKTKPITITKEA